MTADQYRAALKKLGVSQKKMGDYLHVSRRTSQGWALGEYEVPPLIARVLRLVLKGKIALEDLQ